jgi:predicted  nucleic acid-binding Zn ribbon protein
MNKLEHVKGENFNHKVAREQNERDISELQDQLERTNRNLADRIKEMTRTQF